MNNAKFLLVCSLIAVGACANTAPPPASAPAAASSTDPAPATSTSTDDGTRAHGDVKDELAKIDAALADIARRLQVAQDSAKAELQQQLAILQKRDDDLKAQLQATRGQADADADKARREVHRAIVVLDADMKQLEKKLAP